MNWILGFVKLVKSRYEYFMFRYLLFTNIRFLLQNGYRWFCYSNRSDIIWCCSGQNQSTSVAYHGNDWSHCCSNQWIHMSWPSSCKISKKFDTYKIAARIPFARCLWIYNSNKLLYRVTVPYLHLQIQRANSDESRERVIAPYQ